MINSWKILKGLFITDREETFMNRLIQLILRFSWELPQTIAGLGFELYMALAGKTVEVRTFHGVTVCFTIEGLRKGISLGNYIHCWISAPGFDMDKDPMLMHEFGHCFDSRRFGPLYLPVIGIPSLLGARWTELRANRFANKFFAARYGINWDRFENDYRRT